MDIEERIKKFIRDYITYDVEAAVRSFLCPDFRNVHMMRAKKTGERVLEIERVVEKGNKISIVFFCHFPSVWNAVKSVFQAALEETDMEVYLLALPVKVMRENLDYSHEVFFIIGSKGIPARYGGFETFVEKLTKYRISDKIQYHVAVLSDENSVYEYNGAECFRIKVPEIGPAKAVYYDLAALNYSIRYCRKNPEIREPVFYVLACRIGPFIGKYKKKIERSGGRLYINPDGHEWLRGKWILPIRKYWKLSERYMVKHADLVICDSVHIEKYILESYKKYHPDTKYISYGSETELSRLSDKDVLWQTWLRENGLCPDGYYLVVSRFVPENNFEVMIREFMTSKSSRDFVIITTENPKFLKKLEKKLHFSSDPRIKFVGTVYDDALLRKIRENAYGYIHGHEVGGTNPSLLESLGLTKLNLLLKTDFNYEAAEGSALYWTKGPGDLAELIQSAEVMSQEEIVILGHKARNRIFTAYGWEDIAEQYEDLFLDNMKVDTDEDTGNT